MGGAMSSVVISGDTSGAITLSAPAVAGTNTATLPASTGTILTTGSPQSGGVIQTINATSSTTISTTSTTFITSGLTATITPKFSTSKILILFSLPCRNGGTGGYSCIATLFRGTVSGTNLGNATYGMGLNEAGVISSYAVISSNYLDSPATTSATTYTVGFRSESGTNTAVAFNANELGSITLMEIAQ